MTVFFRLLNVSIEDKPFALSESVAAFRAPGRRSENIGQETHEKSPNSFVGIPRSPFAYWASHRVLRIFQEAAPLQREYLATSGTGTLDDFRFLRIWTECPHSSNWFTYAKGGAFSRFYFDHYLTLNWADDGSELKAWIVTRYGGGHWARNIRSTEHYFRAGLTWPRRTQGGFGMRAMPSNCIFADKGPAAFAPGDRSVDLLALLAVCSSLAFRYLVDLQMAFGSYEVGVIQRTPIPDLGGDSKQMLASLARRAWSLKRALDTTNETSHAFVFPPGTIGHEVAAPNGLAGGLGRNAIETELAGIQRQIDEQIFNLYSIGAEDQSAIENSTAQIGISERENEGSEEDEESEDTTIGVPMLRVYSWLVGVAFGRFDKRLATGEREIPPEPEPFDPLPTRSPGMWPEGETRTFLPPDILVDDPGHDHDLTAHSTDAAANTGWTAPVELRQWLAREFFPVHIKMYSKSRRKAPIYWQLATASASYSVWLYIHAFTKDTLYKVQNEYVALKLGHEERKLEALRREFGDTPGAADRKALAVQESFVEELRAFLEEVKRVAPLWNPDLDDGVVINFAPLWRLVPQHKPWQKELKATWEALCAGDYDWAHLAMHLWPERVIPKCATDRSLAIAHGFEGEFWVEGTDGKWKPRAMPLTPIEGLVQQRTSPAVKAALKSLLEAPSAAGTVKRSRKGKANA